MFIIILLLSSMSILNILSIFLVLIPKHNKINGNIFLLLVILGCVPAAFIYAYKITISNVSNNKNVFENVFTISTLSYIVSSVLLVLFSFAYNILVNEQDQSNSVGHVFQLLYSIILFFMAILLIFNVKILFTFKGTKSKIIYIIYFIQLFIILMMSITWGLDINPPDDFHGILTGIDIVDSGQLGSFLFAGINVVVFSSYLGIGNINLKETNRKAYNHSFFGSYGATVFVIILFSILSSS